MASIALVFRKDKLNKKGEAPLHFRIIKNRKPRYITAEIMLHEKFWDFKKNKVKSSYPNSARLNNYLTTRLSEYQNAILESESKNRSLTTDEIRKNLVKEASIDFLKYGYEFIKQYIAKKQIGTHDKCKSILDKLYEYAPSTNLLFSEISPQFLTHYEKYLREELENCNNTINGNMRFISRLFNAALAEGIIEYKDNPFLIYRKPKIEKTHREYLTEKEIEDFESVSTPKNSKLGIHQTIFIFSCYSGGLRISDLLTLQWKNFDGESINFSTNKTDTQLSIFLPNKSLAILKSLKKNDKGKLDFIFPVLPQGMDLDNPKTVDTEITKATSLMNKNLKIIARRAGIEKNISTHTARHTWATRALRKGISIDKVSKLLGHTNIKQTQVYAKIIDSELNKAMLVFNE